MRRSACAATSPTPMCSRPGTGRAFRPWATAACLALLLAGTGAQAAGHQAKAPAPKPTEAPRATTGRR